MDSTTPASKPLLTVPISIILAAAIIGIAIIWAFKPAANSGASTPKAAAITVNLTPISANEHILGNPNASLKIVEYSDPSCPFCKLFNPTMTSVMDTYGLSGKVAWVYRHFPLDKPDQSGHVLHPNAGHEAQALECASALGGNDAFWKFEKRIYEVTPAVTSATPSGLDQKQLPEIAKYAGLDATAFNNCLSSGQMKDIVEKQYLSGVNAGVSGTPTSFFVLAKPAKDAVISYIATAKTKYGIGDDLLYITTDKKTIAVSGAMPKDLIIGLITAIDPS